MRNPFTGIGAKLTRSDDTQPLGAPVSFGHDLGSTPASRRIPLRLVVAGAAVVLLLVVLVVSSLDSSPGDHPTPVARQGDGGNQPWWAGDEVPTSSVSPTPQASSDTYLIVGPETATPSPTASASPGRKSPGGGTAPKPPARVVTFTAVAGDGCEHDATRGYQVIGRYTDGERGWYGRSSGGWERDGCSGDFDALPMSGSADRDDTSAYVVWWFKPGNIRQGRCAISVYIPTGREFNDVAGSPAFYNVIAGKSDYDRIAGFRIDQVPNRGRWLFAGTYPMRDGEIAIQLVTRGEDPNGEHLAAAQVRAACRAS
jgi:hypothetical protein